MPTTITKLATLANRTGRKQRSLPALWLVTDQDRLPDPVRAVARLPRGAGIILRHRDPRERERLAAALVPLCRRRGLVLLIAGDPRLAARVGADGVHFPEARVGEARGWRRRRPRWLMTAAAHNGPALLRAARAGAHAALLSPVFPTASHPQARALGPVRFARLVGAARLPVIALGGITARTAVRLKSAGAVGLAGVGVFAD